MKTAYEIKDLTFRYPGKDKSLPFLFKDLSLEIERASRWAIIGPSGCGKSTLLHLLAGLIQPEKGKIFFCHKPLEKPINEIQIILQDYGLFPWKTVAQNLALPLQMRKISLKERRNQVNQMLVKLSLADFADRYPYELSGGQRQRVAVGRAMITSPSVLLMDEPFSAIDAITQERLQDMLLALIASQNLTTVLVTHQIEEAVRLANHILFIPALFRSPLIIDVPEAIRRDRASTAMFCESIRDCLKEERNVL